MRRYFSDFSTVDYGKRVCYVKKYKKLNVPIPTKMLNVFFVIVLSLNRIIHLCLYYGIDNTKKAKIDTMTFV